MKKLIYPLLGLTLLCSCTKTVLQADKAMVPSDTANVYNDADKNRGVNEFVKFTIFSGQHYADYNSLKFLSLSRMDFVTKFDSSAIYKSVNPDNQYDINKLYGFSEGINHEYYSARIGWAWNDGALRLYAYAYNKGVREFAEITKVSIGSEIPCSISLSKTNYIFTVNNTTVTLPRGVSTATAIGYQLYPYFGGDEVTPHDIFIQIKNGPQKDIE